MRSVTKSYKMSSNGGKILLISLLGKGIRREHMYQDDTWD